MNLRLGYIFERLKLKNGYNMKIEFPAHAWGKG